MSAFPGMNRFSTTRPYVNNNNNNVTKPTPIHQRVRNPIPTENKLGDLEVLIPKDLRHSPMEGRRPLTTNRQSTPAIANNNSLKPNKTPHVFRRKLKRGHHSVISVPGTMKDKDETHLYTKHSFLGEGGFAKCYKVFCPNGRFYAAKVISKSTLHDEKNRIKLFAEISIHRSLNHRSIVRFLNCFEDLTNIYLILELCDNKTLVELLRSRKRLTEPEVRFYLIQVLDACRYMHDNRVIHRDIKLSNTFLDKNMNVKMGDFGLAALLVDRNDRKKTICGTPNYIAPEILFEKTGHDHKVDMWSIGVLMYTLLVGTHPFQQSEVKYIYRKIKANEGKPSYKLPTYLGEDAKDLITKLLVNEPSQRLSVPEVLSHNFFQRGKLPCRIPKIAFQRIPTDEELYTNSPKDIMASPGRAGEALRDAIDANRSYVDRRPLGELRIMNEVIPVARLQFPGRPVYQENATVDKPETPKKSAVGSNVDAPYNRTTPEEDAPRKRRDVEATAEMNPPPAPTTTATKMDPPPPKVREKSKVSILETMARVITETLEEAKQKDIQICEPLQDIEWTPTDIFLDKWLDFTAKYGLCYTLTDGAIGVLFADVTSLLTRDEEHYYYVDHNVTPVSRQKYHKSDIPQDKGDLRKKVCLLQKFKEHFDTNLARTADNMPDSVDSMDNWVFLNRYLKNDKGVVFRLSNGVVQFNFFNHTKLVLLECAKRIVYVPKDRQLKVYSLADALSSDNEPLKKAIIYVRDILNEQVTSRNQMYEENRRKE